MLRRRHVLAALAAPALLTRPARAQGRKLRIGSAFTTTTNAAFLMPKYLKEDGIEAEIVTFPSLVQRMQAVASGDVNAAASSSRVVIGRYRALDQLSDWSIQIFRSVPPIALIPMALLFFGIGDRPTVPVELPRPRYPGSAAFAALSRELRHLLAPDLHGAPLG